MTYHGVQIQHHPDDFLVLEDDGFLRELELARSEKEHPVSIKKQKGPAFVVLGAGAWHAREIQDVAGAEQVANFKAGVMSASKLTSALKDASKGPMDGRDGIGNQVYFVPPSLPKPAGFDARAKVAEIIKGRVQGLQDWLHNETDNINMPQAWAIPEITLGQENTFIRIESTGFHVIPGVAETKAQILLNARCNAKLDRIRGPPYNRTCCTDYGVKPTAQLMLVAAGLAYIAICLLCEIVDLCLGRRNHWKLFNMQTGAFILALLCCYYADRTQMVGKTQKIWRGYSNVFLLLSPAIVLGLATIRKSRSPRSESGPLAVDADQIFLSRDQTEEWKGWMQIYILAYHWCESWKSMWLFALVRLTVAAYLFQTGYNHTTYFLVKKDFSFQRVASVLLRLNLLTLGLAYFMESNWVYYYFSPLCSFWFLATYLIMWIGHRRLNDDTRLLFLKVAVCSILISLVISSNSMTRWWFSVFKTVFNIQWNPGAWNGRIQETMYVPYWGMLLAIANLRMKKSLPPYLRYTLASCGLVLVMAFVIKVMSGLKSNNQYSMYHPFIAVLPIFTFIAFRNISTFTRNYSSRAMIWVGRCSLELYILQGHLWVAADYTGVLIIPGLSTEATARGRIKSLIITIPIFLWISSQAATATGNLVKIILPNASSTSHPAVASKRHVEKDAIAQEDVDPLLEVADAIPLDGYHIGYKDYKDKKRSALSVLALPQFRVLILLLFLWALNLSFPRQSFTPVPDGFTPHRANNG